MAFNAQWELELLARELGKTVPDLLAQFKLDLAEMANSCPVFKLAISASGNYFSLYDSNSKQYEPPAVAGLYSIFTKDGVVYFGEGKDLNRRQLSDPDGTADSGKTFNNQGRAILKLILHKGWANALGLDPVFMQLYLGNCRLSRQVGQTFEQIYKVSRYSKALEGAMGLFAQQCHPLMVARAKGDGF